MEISKKNKAIRIIFETIPYVIIAVMVYVILNGVLKLSSRDFNVPFFYEGGDSAITLYRTFEMKTDYSFFMFDQLGSPYGSNTFDFYVFDIGLFVIQFILALVSSTFIAGYNLFLISGAWFNAFSALYSLKRLKFSSAVSVVLALIYSALPYFFMRYSGHTYLSYYYAAPLTIAFAIELYRDEFVLSWAKEKRKKTVINVILLMLIGTSGVYYAVFSCIFFLLVAVMRGLEDLKFKSSVNSIKAIFFTFAMFILGAVPVFIYWLSHGMGSTLDKRIGYLWGGEEYGLEITNLVLPNVYNRIGILRKIIDNYVKYFGANESMTAALGLVLTIGLIISFVYIFRIASSGKKEIMRPVSLLTVAAILITTKGGFGTFFAAVFPFIRCYNRMSVYIAFLCAVSLAWGMDSLYKIIISKVNKSWLKITVNCVSILLLIGILNFGLYEETFEIGYDEGYNMSRYNEDQQFVDSIVDYAHSLDSEDLMVDSLFLPHMDFPENIRDTGGRLLGYEPMNLCVHSEDFAVSYGAARGREFSLELDNMGDGSMASQIDYAISMGYDGIVISTDAISTMDPDNISILEQRLGPADISNSKYMFWSLEDLA